MKTFASEKGYPSCFVVAYRDGKRVKLSEVLSEDDQ